MRCVLPIAPDMCCYTTLAKMNCQIFTCLRTSTVRVQFFRQSVDIRDVNNHRAPQRIGMQPFSNFSELLATSCSYTNFMMVSQMVQELSRWQNKQTNRQTDKHTHKRTLPKTNQGRDDVTSSTNCFKCQFKCTSSVGTSRKLKTRHSAEWRIRWYGRIFFSWSK